MRREEREERGKEGGEIFLLVPVKRAYACMQERRKEERWGWGREGHRKRERRERERGERERRCQRREKRTKREIKRLRERGFIREREVTGEKEVTGRKSLFPLLSPHDGEYVMQDRVRNRSHTVILGED